MDLSYFWLPFSVVRSPLLLVKLKTFVSGIGMTVNVNMNLHACRGCHAIPVFRSRPSPLSPSDLHLFCPSSDALLPPHLHSC